MQTRTLSYNLLIFIPIFFIGLGIIMIYSSSSIFAAQKFHDSTFFLKKQALFGVFAIICMFAAAQIPYAFLKKLSYPLWLMSIVLLILVLVPGIGTKVGGAVRWLKFGPLSFQPSEFAKLAVVILLSHSLAKKEREEIKRFSIGVLPHLIFVIPISLLIIVQPDFGTAMMLIALLFTMLFAAGIPLKYLTALSALSSAAASILILCKGYRFERLLTFMDPWKNPTGSGFQIVQSFLGFGAGGLYGTGLGKGTQKLFFLPEPHTDFILSVIGEELGFLGVLLVISLFIIIFVSGIRISIYARDLFGTYLALGITFFIGLQAAINMCVVMGLLPTKGTPLPFLSYGGTSLLCNAVSIGILLNISTQCNFKTRN